MGLVYAEIILINGEGLVLAEKGEKGIFIKHLLSDKRMH
jgi:hypothetical protein